MKEEESKKAVYLSADLYGKLEERVKDSEFESVDEYVVFVIEELVKDEEEEEKVLTEREEEEVKKRLKALGYLE